MSLFVCSCRILYMSVLMVMFVNSGSISFVTERGVGRLVVGWEGVKTASVEDLGF